MWHATPAFFAYLWKQGKTAQRRAHQQRSTAMAVWVWGTLAMLKQQQPLKNNTEWCWDGARSTYSGHHEQQQQVLRDAGLCVEN